MKKNDGIPHNDAEAMDQQIAAEKAANEAQLAADKQRAEQAAAAADKRRDNEKAIAAHQEQALKQAGADREALEKQALKDAKEPALARGPRSHGELVRSPWGLQTTEHETAAEQQLAEHHMRMESHFAPQGVPVTEAQIAAERRMVQMGLPVVPRDEVHLALLQEQENEERRNMRTPPPPRKYPYEPRHVRTAHTDAQYQALRAMTPHERAARNAAYPHGVSAVVDGRPYDGVRSAAQATKENEVRGAAPK